MESQMQKHLKILKIEFRLLQQINNKEKKKHRGDT